MNARDEANAPAAVVRLEQLYPWPGEQLAEVLRRYPPRTEVVWLQEEPANMGAWSFVKPRLEDLLSGDMGRPLRAVTRLESGSPAAGSGGIHELEHSDILSRALGI